LTLFLQLLSFLFPLFPFLSLTLGPLLIWRHNRKGEELFFLSLHTHTHTHTHTCLVPGAKRLFSARSNSCGLRFSSFLYLFLIWERVRSGNSCWIMAKSVPYCWMARKKSVVSSSSQCSRVRASEVRFEGRITSATVLDELRWRGNNNCPRFQSYRMYHSIYPLPILLDFVPTLIPDHHSFPVPRSADGDTSISETLVWTILILSFLCLCLEIDHLIHTWSFVLGTGYSEEQKKRNNKLRMHVDWRFFFLGF
jgi:hypothetical protein